MPSDNMTFGNINLTINLAVAVFIRLTALGAY